MADRFSLPDESSIYRGNSEDGSLGTTDDIFHSEELPSGDSNSYIKGDRLSGGGEGASDRFSENRDSMDAEYLRLCAEYNRFMNTNKEGIDDISFEKWLDRTDSVNLPKRERKPFVLELRTIEGEHVSGPDNESYDNIVELVKSGLWRGEDTVLTYKIKDESDPKQDMVAFSNDDKSVDIKVSDFNGLLEKNLSKNKVRRPEDLGDMRTINLLHFLKIGSSNYRGENFKVEYDRSTESYELSLNENSLTRKVDEESVGDVKDFWGIWTHGQGEIRSIGFELNDKKNKITAVKMHLETSKTIRIPAYVFRAVFDGVSPCEDYWGNPSGFKFVNRLGKAEDIHPGTSQQRLDSIIHKISIDGVKLSNDINVSIENKVEDLVGASR